MSRRRQRTAPSDNAGVDMTPMLDIVFILLIFFIVTAVFIDETGMDFTQAQGDVPPGPPTDVIAVVVDASDAVTVQGRTVPIAFVEAEVQRHLVEHPEAAIDLRAAETASHYTVVTIKDEMELAGRDVRFETYAVTQSQAQLD